jgi:hypothetical protein
MNENLDKYMVLDEQIQYHFREDRLAKAQKLGYEFISQATVELYRQHKSCIKVGKIIGVNERSIRYELKFKIGEPLRGPGSFPGEVRRPKHGKHGMPLESK